VLGTRQLVTSRVHTVTTRYPSGLRCPLHESSASFVMSARACDAQAISDHQSSRVVWCATVTVTVRSNLNLKTYDFCIVEGCSICCCTQTTCSRCMSPCFEGSGVGKSQGAAAIVDLQYCTAALSVPYRRRRVFTPWDNMITWWKPDGYHEYLC
jgi:hypothetical protein